MDIIDEVTLLRDCSATLIPAGGEITLPAGSRVMITQALGGSVTVRSDHGLLHIGPSEMDALGPEVAAQYGTHSGDDESDVGDGFSEVLVWDALRTCFDPEIPVNIVDLGLIYDLAVNETESGSHHVDVKMTLTAQGCGMGPVIAADAKAKIEALPVVESASVDIVWDPQWDPHMISAEGRKMLGLG